MVESLGKVAGFVTTNASLHSVLRALSLLADSEAPRNDTSWCRVLLVKIEQNFGDRNGGEHR